MNNQLKTIALLGGMSVLLVGVGTLVGGSSYLLPFALLAFGMSFFSYFYSDKIVLKVNRARPVSASEAPELHAIIEEVAAAAGVPKPMVCVVDDDTPNAFATGRNPEHGVVAVTRGIMRILSRRELKGVIAHEMSHVKNRDILIASVAAMIATTISIIASVARFSAIFGGARNDDRDSNPIALLVLAIVAPIAATVIQLGISRSREFLADETGARLIGDPEALASALAKLESANHRSPLHTLGDTQATASLYIVNPLSAQGIAKLFSTHPPMAERIARLRALR